MRHRRLLDTLPLIALIALVPLVASACATDNGPTAYGETFGPLPERHDGGASGEDGGVPRTDAGVGTPDAAADGGVACSEGSLALLAGADATLAGAVQERGGAWKVSPLAGAARSLRALVATKEGFVGASRSTSDALVGLALGAAWAIPVGIGTATTIGAPSLAASGGASSSLVHLALHTPAFEHAYGASAQGTWSAASEPLRPPPGPTSFGPSAPSIAAVSGEVVAAFDGDDGGLYVQTRSALGAWGAAGPVVGAGVHKPVPPALVALEGTHDLLVVFADASPDHVLRHAVRASSGKAWSAVANTGALAFTSEPFRAARISPSEVAIGYRGGDGRAYVTIGTLAAGSFTWAAPVPLFAGAPVEAAPAIAPGVCGDAAVAAVGISGAVKVTRLRAGAWTAPEEVPGLSGTRVAVATR